MAQQAVGLEQATSRALEENETAEAALDRDKFVDVRHTYGSKDGDEEDDDEEEDEDNGGDDDEDGDDDYF